MFSLHRQHRKSFSATRHLADVMLRLGMALSLPFLAPPFQAQTSPSPEYYAKAHFLSKFPIFIEWPENALPAGHAPFLICVFGDFPFGTSLAEKTQMLALARRVVITAEPAKT